MNTGSMSYYVLSIILMECRANCPVEVDGTDKKLSSTSDFEEINVYPFYF